MRVPPHAIVEDVDAALAFAGVHGYPIVLKRSHGFAGSGVAIIAGGDELPAAMTGLAKAQALDLGRAASPRLIAQAFIPGAIVSRPSAAWRGRELAGVTRIKVVRHPPVTGPGTVTRSLLEPEARAFSEALIAGLGITGLLGIEYVVDARTGERVADRDQPPRDPGHAHRRAGRHRPLRRAARRDRRCSLSAAPHDVAPGFERTVARFPQEWLRDPASPYLRDCPVDAPWDDPDLLAALLAMRHVR